jgi:hypothetical protein
MLDRGPRPDFFDYPALEMYLLAGLYWVYSAAGRAFGWVQAGASVNESFRLEWEPFFLIARAVSVVLGTATVAVVYGIARSLFDRTAALLAALFMALAFLHVRDSHYGTTDVPMTFFLTCAMLAIVRVYTRGRRSDAQFAGVFAGLAAATKYNAVLLALPMLAVAGRHAWTRRENWRAAVRESPLPWMAVPFVAVFLATNPYLLIDTERVLRDLRLLQQSAATGMTPPELLGRGWTYHLPFSLRYGLGWPLVIASLIGLVWMFRKRPYEALVLSVFPVAYYAVAGAGYNVFVRYMIPVVPFLCVYAGFAVAEAAAGLAGRAHSRSALAAAVLGAVVVAPSALSVIRFDALLAREDSRLVAGRWVHENVPASSRIYMAGNLYGHLQLERDRPFKYRYVEFDRRWQSFKEDERPVAEPPDYIVIQRSGITYSHVPPQVSALLRSRYSLLYQVRAADLQAPGNVYDIQDGFYAPYGGFKRVSRPGPNLEIYRRVPIP